jgi:hypothetical protein
VQAWYERCPGEYFDDQIETAVGDEADLGVEEIDLEDSISESGALEIGGGSCPTPPTFTVLGHTIAMPAITWICDFAAAISGIVVAFAYLMALGIVGKAVMA